MKKIKVLIYDNSGLYINLAIRLSEDFEKVFYFHEWKVDYPVSTMTSIGAGFKEFEKVLNVWDVYDEVDLWIFPTIYNGDLQMFLEKQGKLVWGSREGEAMEIYRWDFIEFQKKIGMAVAPSKLVTGITALRKELYKSTQGKFVKIDATERGDIETFKYINPEITEINDIRPLEHRLGINSELMNFIIQDGIPTKVETGYDGFTVDGKFPETALFGIEVKDMGYIGEVRKYKDLPEGVKEVNKELSDALKSYGYRGNISTEIREGEDGKHYLIDLTCRFPYPPSNLMLEIWDNIAECIYEGAKGNLVDMKFRAKYGIEIEMFSDTAEEEYYTLFYPKEIQQWLKQPYLTFKEGRRWVIPQNNKNQNVGSLIAIGNTIEECVKLAKERAEQITGHHLKIDFSALDEAIEELRKL